MPGVIFDMDGVLVDSGAPHQRSWEILAQRHDVSITPDFFRGNFGRTSRDIVRRIWGNRIDERLVGQFDREKEEIYRELIADRVPLMPGCRRLLERLRNAGFALGVATSGPPENLELVLSEGLIASYFDAEVNGFEIAVGKPAPDCFLLAAARLAVPPESCVVVEDAPVGIQAAVAAGMRAIGLIGTHPAEVLQQAGAARVVSKLDDITTEMVSELAAQT